MGSYAYCYDCEAPISPPSLKEAYRGFSECPNCGAKHDWFEFELDYALDAIDDGIPWEPPDPPTPEEVRAYRNETGASMMEAKQHFMQPNIDIQTATLSQKVDFILWQLFQRKKP